MHVGSLGTVLEPGRSSVVDLVRRAVEDDVFVSYDPNIRPFFLDDPAAAWRDVVALGAGARLLKLSDEDLRLLRPGSDEEDVCRELLAGEHTELVVLTRGSRGAVAFTDGATLAVPAPRDRRGRHRGCRRLVHGGDAGDAQRLGRAGRRRHRARSTTTGSSCWCRAPSSAAAMTCSRRGANPPRRRELPPTWPTS